MRHIHLPIKTIFLSLLLLSRLSFADVEEARVDKAEAAMPQLLQPFESLLNEISTAAATGKLDQIATQGWQIGKKVALEQGDDRPLYWFRLAAKKRIRQLPITDAEKAPLLAQFERFSRGIEHVDYAADRTTKRILLTGFDPFLLDRNISQSNPSGLAALLLDGVELQTPSGKARIETVMIPVRFADFDQGIIENLVQPYLKAASIDMLVTVSMGRADFDLEHFPGLRRSAFAPDNLNVYTGGTSKNPVLPLLNNGSLLGSEFVEFSLPYKAMQQAEGPYKVNDNRKVETLAGTFEAESLEQLRAYTSVQGGGGGYLSNEISYRTVRMRDLFNADIPVGHIHTPRIKGYERETEETIVKQIKAMLEKAAETL